MSIPAPFRRISQMGKWRWLLVILVSAGWVVLAGIWTPRSPLTTVQGLWSMGISVAVGLISGGVARSRWCLLVAPATFASAFELTRLGADGPTVGPINATPYGLIALIGGRGFHALVSILPIALGAAIGAGIARRWEGVTSGRKRARHLRSGVAIVAASGLVAFAVVLARPASTEPIPGPDGAPLAGSIAELGSVKVDGRELGMMIRGYSTDNPVLLYLAGGPGASERGPMRNHLSDLEKYFTVATWDQRGTGTSYSALDPTRTHTLDNAVADTITVTNYLRQRFGRAKIYLLGQSWGSVLGVLAVQKEPQLYAAYVGTGQIVSPLATDRIHYQDTLAWAHLSGNATLAEQLAAVGPPPYKNIFNYMTLQAHEGQVYPYDHAGNSEGVGGLSATVLVPEYALVDQVHLLGAFLDTFAALYPQAQDLDFRTDAMTLAVPVFFVEGAHEARGRSEPFHEWYDVLAAPGKEMVVLPTSGHAPLFEQPHQFITFMIDVVLAA